MGKNKKNPDGREGHWKQNSFKEEVKENKFLQSELHCRAYKLYSPEEQLGSQFILQRFNFLDLVYSPITWFSLQLGKRYPGCQRSSRSPAVRSERLRGLAAQPLSPPGTQGRKTDIFPLPGMGFLAPYLLLTDGHCSQNPTIAKTLTFIQGEWILKWNWHFPKHQTKKTAKQSHH